MFLRIADKLIKQGDFAGALNAIAKARENDPGNRYAIAYEARVRTLMDEAARPKRKSERTPVSVQPEPVQSLRTAGPATEMMPSVMGQLNAIATPLPPPDSKRRDADSESKSLAILSKIASLLGAANDHLAKHEYDRALEVVARAALLDPNNADIRTIESRIRSAQDEARRREEQESETRAAAERIRRDHLMQEQMERLHREQEDRRRQDEAERVRAQKQKALQVISRARDFLASGHLQEAQCELAYVTVIDPENPDVVSLEREISARAEAQHRAQLEAYRRELEEQRKREQAVREEIAAAVREAEALATRDKYSEALRAITRAYILDPSNGDLQACEIRILTAQKEWSARVEREKKEQEEALRQKLEEEEQRRREEEQERLLREEREREEARRRELREKAGAHLALGLAHIDAGRLKEAHEEAAAAFLVDPFNEEILVLEKRIADAQAEAARATETRPRVPVTVPASPPVEPSPAPLPVPPVEAAVEAEAEARERQRREDEERRRTEEEARREEDQRKRQEERKRKDQRQILKHLRNAHRHMAAERFEEALAETDQAFLINPDDEEVRAMKQRIIEEVGRIAVAAPPQPERESTQPAAAVPQELPAAEAPADPDSPRAIPQDEAIEAVVARSLAEARRLASDHRYGAALDEVALALSVDPQNPLTQRLEASIRQEFSEYRKRESALRHTSTAPSSRQRMASSKLAPSRASSQARAGKRANELSDRAVDRLLSEGVPAGEPNLNRETGDMRRWKRRAILSAAVLGVLLLIVFSLITPSGPAHRPGNTPLSGHASPAAGR